MSFQSEMSRDSTAYKTVVKTELEPVETEMLLIEAKVQLVETGVRLLDAVFMLDLEELDKQTMWLVKVTVSSLLDRFSRVLSMLLVRTVRWSNEWWDATCYLLLELSPQMFVFSKVKALPSRLAWWLSIARPGQQSNATRP